MQEIDDVEDGELSDEASNEYIEPYQAVERPASFAPVKHFAPQLVHEDSSESSSESSSDSSSEEDFRPAKKRQKFNAKAPLGIAPATVKRNVWSSVIFEDHIEKELKDVNVHTGKTLLDKSRDVESYYNYGRKLAGRLGGEEIAEEAQIQEKLIQLDKKDGGDSFQPAEEEPNSSTTADDFERSLQETQQLLKSRKRKMDDRQVDEPKKNKAPGISKSLRQRMQRVEDLSVTATSSPLDVAKDIGLKLHEEKSELITRAVNIIGVEAAIKLFKDTQEAENDGGIYVADGSRRRTPGGVFFYLLRNHFEIPVEQIREVFSEEIKAKDKHRKEIRAKRRNQQAEKLKQAIASSEDLPPLPTRVELELQKKQLSQPDDAIDCTEEGELNDPDDNIVDIHFDCD